MIQRTRHREAVAALLAYYPGVAILGARQVGKTTLARQIAQGWNGPSHHFDLESPEDLARLAEPSLALGPLEGLVVIDEVQRKPGLFEVLRVLMDRPRVSTRFLLLGSAAPHLIQQGSETLAGRLAFYDLHGFASDELDAGDWQGLWVRGGFPRATLAPTDALAFRWRRDFVRSFLERDLPQLGSRVPSHTIRRFWTMLAHYHGQTWNASEFGRSFGVADTTVRRYLDLLVSTYVIRSLPPWWQNLRKRQVKSPKVYLHDSGLLHVLLNLPTFHDLQAHPKLGASWEGFALGEVIAALGATPEECFFWASHGGAELDLLVVRGQRRLGFEFEYSDSPKRTRSMLVAAEDLQLDTLTVVHAGQHAFPLGEGIRAVPMGRLWELIEPLSA